MENKAVFLDRDGVINVDHAYVHKIEDFEFIPGVFEACRKFVAAGYRLIVVTNQSGIGRGYYSEADFQRLTEWMKGRFAEEGAPLSAVYFCPHHPKNAVEPYKMECQCRKPGPGMLLDAIAEFDIDPSLSVMVGDKGADMEAAKAAGVGLKILMTTGQQFSEEDTALADRVCHSLTEVVPLI